MSEEQAKQAESQETSVSVDEPTKNSSDTSPEIAAVLDKFGGRMDEMAKAYAHLSKKLGEPKQVPKTAAPKPTNQTQLKNELGTWSQNIIERLGLPAEKADYAVSNVANQVMDQVAKTNALAVNKLIDDRDTMTAVKASFESDEEYNDFHQRFKDGRVTEGEVRVRARLGATLPEKPDTVPESPKSKESVGASEQHQDELKRILANHEHPYFNQHHKDHARAVEHVTKLKEKMGEMVVDGIPF